MLRGAGVLLHITSLPGGCYTGDLGPEAYAFAEALAYAEQTYWQTLPINHTLPEYENSPYSAASSFAGDPHLISLDAMKRDGLIDQVPQCPPTPRADYQAAWEIKTKALEKAYKRHRRLKDFTAFMEEEWEWLGEYATYMALREKYGPYPPRGDAPRDRVEFYAFAQFVFWTQWRRLKEYVNGLGIFLIGDLPYYPGPDSADVWAHPRLFKVGQDGRPLYVGGVPPDYFSPTGQLWGNPVYNWEEMEREGYRWWIRRLKHALRTFDYVRIDHFRGYAAYWEVPAGEPTAVRGRWVPGPGKRLFDAAAAEVDLGRLVAEDLGYITPDVEELRDSLGLPGMRVLQFAWDGNPANPHKPHNHVKNLLVYTGTHDNNTAVGWFREEATPAARREVLKYGNCRPREINWCLIRLAHTSVADVAIVPMQDVLGLGSEARMNKPGTVGGNWRWRLAEQPPRTLLRKLREVTRLYGR